MPFLNLDTFAALFNESGMAFQRMLLQKARDFYLLLAQGFDMLVKFKTSIDCDA